MSLRDRDKKLLIVLVPIVVLGAFWFLLLSPKRDEAAKAEKEAVAQEERRDAAQAQLTQASAAQTDFAADYGEIVRLGKAIPAQVDMPSLLVQLESAAEGTGIRFTKISTGDRVEAPAPAPATPPDSTADGSEPVAAGGEQAQSGPGTAAEAANTAAGTADQRSEAAEQSGVDAADTATSASSGQGLPIGGGATAAGSGAGATSTAGLETVPLELEFVGDFFNLADFFHDVKRFVRVAGTNVVVGGRLITIESVSYSSDQTIFPKIKAELTATIYLSPKVEGTTAGATPEGPPATTPASTPTDPAAPAPAAPTPTAVATP